MRICNIRLSLQGREPFPEEPENDAISHVKQWATELAIKNPQIIGWDFPVVSQEQINVFHMHGYAAALILPTGDEVTQTGAEIIKQPKQRYVAITIKEPFKKPFYIIANACKTLLAYINVNGIEENKEENLLQCFEKEYVEDGVDYMDVYILIK